MYYEEKLIRGAWYFRITPSGKWELMGHSQLHAKLLRLDKELKECKELESKVLCIVELLSEELERDGYDEMWTPQIKLTVIKRLLKGTK